MIRKLWLVFCQTATVCVAALFVITTLRPDLLAWKPRGSVVTIREAAPEGEAKKISSYSDAAKRAMPAVVNIYTAKEMTMQRHPFMDDPVFRHFFGEQFDAQTRRSTNRR
jgi:serine protease DegQ